MTKKKAQKLIKKLTTEAIAANNDNKIDIIVRKIEILKDFIIFKIDTKKGW